MATRLIRSLVFRAPANYRLLSTSPHFKLISDDSFSVDRKYFECEQNRSHVLKNIRLRQVEEDFPELFRDNLSSDELTQLMVDASKRLPNDLHPSWLDSENDMKIVDIVGTKVDFNFEPQKAEKILNDKNLIYFSDLRHGKLGIVGGRRAYAYVGDLAKLARVLAKWTLDKLVKDFHFTPVIIPNLIHSDVIKACGFEPHGPRTQVYALENLTSSCLAGTAEMPLASMHIGECFPNEEQLPKRYCALSRCYRAEAKATGEMSGLYRVHYFDKVEMFGITESQPGCSDHLLEEFVSIQKTLFTELGLHFRVVDMPPMDLGQPAYRKFDIEAYMPGRDFWGELSSASNCTDYQSKRLNITYNEFTFDKITEEITGVTRNFAHTVNGTACAIPRMLIAIVEQNQDKDGKVSIPEVLRPLMNVDEI